MSSLQMQLEFQRKNLYDSLRQEMLELAAAGQIEYHRLMAIEECDDITFGLCKQFEIIDNYLPGNQLPPSIQKDVSAPEIPWQANLGNHLLFFFQREHIKTLEKNLNGKEALLSETSLHLIELDAEMSQIEADEKELLAERLDNENDKIEQPT